jgi:hypothetical protein
MLSLPCSVAGWACGTRARANGSARGRTAIRLGLAGVALAAVAIVVWLVLALGFDIGAQDLRDALERRTRR